MFKRFCEWTKVMAVKVCYVAAHPQVLWKEYKEEVRARMWARNVAKNK